MSNTCGTRLFAGAFFVLAAVAAGAPFMGAEFSFSMANQSAYRMVGGVVLDLPP